MIKSAEIQIPYPKSEVKENHQLNSVGKAADEKALAPTGVQLKSEAYIVINYDWVKN